ncbi:zinc transporter [Sphingomonas sp.]|uniref:ZIP family metal transporter n=1 Tax=Sphingomonas sp. TaxID=28214 RepID=UPI0025E8DF68|nr:zinc transporter [Sphingomonas sp.]
MMTLIVVAVVSGALLAGAAWGIYGRLGPRLEGFLIALAGGALILSLVSELIEPAAREVPLHWAMGGVAMGAISFALLDYLIDEVWGGDSGGGLLAAITLDGVPENLALGVALIGAGPMAVAALAGSIFLSNLPEAAGGARDMAKAGRSKGAVMLLWTATAVLLSIAAIVGNVALAGVDPGVLAVIRCFAAGAVVASLATEVFPKAYREDHHLAGIATALGLVLAFLLGELGPG